jgi:glycosyltransferase involved in cell wall biosynthesis
VAPLREIKGSKDSDFRLEWLKIPHFNGPTFYSAVKQSLEKISPDAVFVTNGNLLKPYLIAAASRYPTLVRLYAYELRCLVSYGILFHDGHVCNCSFLHQPYRCIACGEDKKRILNNVSTVDRPEFFQSLKFLYPYYYILVKRSIGKISRAIATSNYMKQQFSGIIPLDRIEIVPDGVDSSVFSPKRRLSSKGNVKRVTFAGRIFDPVKGLNTLLNASAMLWRKRRDFGLFLTGSHRGYLKKYPFIESDSWLDDVDVPGMYANSDLVVVPSIWGEPFGLTALEAMSCEVPVLASRVGGLQEIVRDGENGLLFTAGSYTELAEKMDQLLDDEDLRRRLGRQGRRCVVQNYSWSQIIDRYISILEDMIKQHKMH